MSKSSVAMMRNKEYNESHQHQHQRQQRGCVLNVLEYFNVEKVINLRKDLQYPYKRTAAALHMSESTVCVIAK